MSLATLLDLGSGEVTLILALILVLLGARKLPELVEGLRRGINEFRKATREVTDEITGAVDLERPKVPVGHPVLVALTFVLGGACLILVVYEFAK